MLFTQFEETFYKGKLYNLYARNNHFLLKCKDCHKVFTNWKFKQTKILKCPVSNNKDDLHEKDKEFNPKNFLVFVKKYYKMTWREIYWKVWSFINVFLCG